MDRQKIVIPTVSIKNAMGENLGYQNIKEQTHQKLFLKKLNVKQQEYNKMNKPFDYLGAKIDFEDALETFYKELRRNGVTEEVVLKESKRLNLDLDKYGKSDRFELLKEDFKREVIVVHGMRENRITFRIFEYRSKVRGNGITVHMPYSDWEVMQKENADKKVATVKVE